MENKKTDQVSDDKASISSYEPPSIEVVEVSIERGFADSAKDWEEDSW